MKSLQISMSTLRLLTDSRPFINYVSYGLLLLMFSFVGGALVELILPLDTTKYLYRAVVLIPGLILLPVQLAQKKFHVFLLPACYLLFGTISTLWSHASGINDLGTALERSLYIISLVALVLYIKEHRKVFDKYLPIVSVLVTLPILFDIIDFFLFQSRPRLYGDLGMTHPNIAGLVYGICAIISVSLSVKKDLIFNCLNWLLLFSGVVSTAAVFLTGSRACSLSLLLALSLFYLIKRRGKGLALALLVLFTSGAATISVISLKFTEQKITQPLKEAISRPLNRTGLWQAMIERMDTKEYFYGRGLSVDQAFKKEAEKTEKFIHPHSLLLSSFYYTGAFGTLMHLMLFLAIFYASLKAALAGKTLLVSLFIMSLLPTAVDGLGIHPYIGYLTPHLLIFWFLYALASSEMYTK